MTTAALSFGTLDVKLEAPLFGILDPGEPWIAALADGADWGSPEAVVATVASMLMDGNKSQITRFGNRIAVLPLRITGENLDVVSAGEALVMAEVNKGRNVFNWTPPGPAETSVFDVVYSKLDFKIDDLAEVNQVTRYFTLTMECMPSARRAEASVVIADPIPAGTPSHDLVDDCTSLTGWAATYGNLSVAGGAIHCTPVNVWTTPAYYAASFSRDGLSIPVLDAEFIVLDLEGGFDLIEMMTADGSGIGSDIVATQRVGGNRARWFISPPEDATVARVKITKNAEPGSATDIIVHEIYRTDQLPFSGSRRQRSFTADVGGTARTAASLRVELDPDTDFATDFLLYTAPINAAVSPPMRRWLGSSGAVTNDATAVSGSKTALSTPSVYEIPAANIPPGTHLICARLNRSSGSGEMTFTWAATTTEAPFATNATDVAGSTMVPLTTAWSIHEIGIVSLPTVAVPSSTTANVSLAIQGPAGSQLDELWLFNLDTGVLTWLTDLDASGEAPTAYEVRSADLDTALPSWRVGQHGSEIMDISVADRAKSPGVHEFLPGLMDIFIVTPADTNQTVIVTYFEHFRHHVTRLES